MDGREGGRGGGGGGREGRTRGKGREGRRGGEEEKDDLMLEIICFYQFLFRKRFDTEEEEERSARGRRRTTSRNFLSGCRSRFLGPVQSLLPFLVQ